MWQPANEAERIVIAFFSALGSDDWDTTRALMAPDMTWTILSTGVPGAGQRRGPDEIFATIRPIRALFEPGSPVITIRKVTSNDATVVIETHGGGRFKDGRVYDNQYAMSIDVADGRVVALREYMDSFYVNGLGLGG